MAYTKTIWRNNQSPPINAANLNNIENGIESVDQRLEVIENEYLKVVRKTIPTQEWPTGGKWLGAPYVDANTEPGYVPVAVLSARPNSSSNLIPVINVDLTDYTFRGYVRNLSSSAITNQEIWCYVLYMKIV